MRYKTYQPHPTYKNVVPTYPGWYRYINGLWYRHPDQWEARTVEDTRYLTREELMSFVADAAGREGAVSDD